VHGADEVVDQDRPPDAELVAQTLGGGELVGEALVRGQMLSGMRLARVDEVPAVLGVLRSELVEQRTLRCAVRSGEGAELEHQPLLAPEF
jgi:hypothetical protein